MSFTEKLRLRLPAYLIFSFLGLLSLLSLWLPKFVGNPDSAEAALTYSATTTIHSVPNNSHNRMISVGGVYYVAFTSSTGVTPTSTCGPSGSCNLFFTTSSNGVNWSPPVQINTGIAVDETNNSSVSIGSLTYNAPYGYFAIAYKRQTDADIYTATSTDGVTWRGGAVVNGTTGGTTAPSGRIYTAFATSTNLAAMAFRKEGYIYVATNTSPGVALASWTSSTAANISYTYDGNVYQAEVLGVNIEGTDTIHVIYGAATSSQTHFISLRSTNRGATWTTSTISGPISIINSNLTNSTIYNGTAAPTVLGRLAILYREFTAADLSGMPTSATATSRLIYGIQDSSGNWVTSTFSTQGMTAGMTDMTGYVLESPALTIFNNTQPAGIFYATSSVLALSINTSSLVTETVTTDLIRQEAGMSIALNTTTRELGMLYVSGYQMRFVTTSLRDPSWNYLPTSTAITPSFATSGTGYVTVTSSISDVDGDSTTLYVDYSLNGGTTWASTTLASASASSGSVSTAAGRVTGISTASANTVTFVWDTKADGVTATTTAMIRIAGADLYGLGLYRQSATFTVDNVPLSAPASQSVSVSTSSVTFSWADVSGANTYTVSSTAGSASTTASSVTSTSYTGLSPNTLYSFQVLTTDAYGNTSTLSSASSTYTDPAIPASVSASAAGTTSMTVSWSANSNGSGTVYEVYNVTAGALSATTTATSYTVTSLTANTSYQFKVRAQYLANSASTTAYSATSTAASTNSESSSSSGSSGGSAAAPAAAPAVPVVAPVVPATSRTETFEVSQPKPVSVGGANHTVTVRQASDSQVTAEIRSNPIIVTLKKGESRVVDTDEDQINDIKVEYRGLANGKPEFTFTNLTDNNERNNAVTINAGAYETIQTKVRLDFKVPTAVQMAISADPSFSTASFQTYQPSVTWSLSGSKGQKTVYVRFRTAAGGIASAQDSINLVVDAAPENKPNLVESTGSGSVLVTYQFKQNLFAGSRGAVVTELQKLLKERGYLQADVTGFYGSQTVAAVKAFQKANGIQQTGGVGPATRAILNKGIVTPVAPTVAPVAPSVGSEYKFTQNLYIGARGVAVTELQHRLKALGYMEDAATGFYGNATKAAVKKYQAASGIQQTGGVGPATRAILNK